MLASLLAALVSGEVVLAMRQAGRTAAAYAVAGVLATLGAAFLLAALYVATAREFGVVGAAVGFGLVFLLLAGVTILSHRMISSARASRAALRRTSEIQAVALASAASLAPSLLRGRIAFLSVLAPAIAAGAYAFYRLRSARKPNPARRRR